MTNPHIGHLGIFVSAGIARFEHRAILDSLGKIEALPPGLYEMKIDNPTGDPDCRHDAYTVRFEERRVEDLRFPVDRVAFERVREVSAQVDFDLFRDPRQMGRDVCDTVVGNRPRMVPSDAHEPLCLRQRLQSVAARNCSHCLGYHPRSARRA